MTERLKSKRKLINMSLRAKLLVSFLLVGIIPFSFMGAASLRKSSNALSNQAFGQLKSMREVKKSQIENFFDKRKSDIMVLSSNQTVIEALDVFSETFLLEGQKASGPQWEAVKEIYAHWLIKYKKEYGHRDLLLISKEGNVVYSVAEKSDLGQDLVGGPLKDSPLAKVFSKALKKGDVALADFRPYAPSGGEPAAFAGAPVMKDDEAIGVVALEISTDEINKIMHERSGLGETGETYLVGTDKRMRSDSSLDPEGHSIKASFAGTIDKNGVDTKAAREALAGKTGTEIITNYRGNKVLSAYTPVKVWDATWALIAEIDRAEAFTAVKAIKWMMALLGIIGVGAIVGFALLIVRSIIRPINAVTDGMRNIAEGEGDLTRRLDESGTDEIAELAGAFNRFAGKIQVIIRQVADAALQVAKASKELSVSSNDLSERISEQAAGLEQTAASMEEMSASVKEEASHATSANSIAVEARSKVQEGGDVVVRASEAMDAIKTSSKRIVDIIAVIDEIAFQTNLLALNAAVEAARAGDQGRGFAVVAGEVRNLAQRSASAAKEIKDLIEDSVGKVENGAKMMEQSGLTLEEIMAHVVKLAEAMGEIAASIQEQSGGVEQVNHAVTQMDVVTQQNAAVVEQLTVVSAEMSSQAEGLLKLVSTFKTGDKGGRPTAAEKRKSEPAQPEAKSPKQEKPEARSALAAG